MTHRNIIGVPSLLRFCDYRRLYKVVHGHGFFGVKGRGGPLPISVATPRFTIVGIGLHQRSLKVKVQDRPNHLPLLVPFRFPPPAPLHFDSPVHSTSMQGIIASPPTLGTNMNSYSDKTTFDYTCHNTDAGFTSFPAGRRVAPSDADMGPWGWQWRDGLCNLTSVSLEAIPIPVKTLMDDIEKVKMLYARVLLIANEGHSGRTGDVQNYHRLGLLKLSRMPLHCR